MSPIRTLAATRDLTRLRGGSALGLRVPEIVLLMLDPALGPSEPNQKIRDLLRASVGLNLGMRYLPKAFTFDPSLPPPLDPGLASAIVWFDAHVTNPDRTLRNVNILDCEHELWLIDHGVALYFHHDWRGYRARSRSPCPLIKHHALLPHAAYRRPPMRRRRLASRRSASQRS